MENTNQLKAALIDLSSWDLDINSIDQTLSSTIGMDSYKKIVTYLDAISTGGDVEGVRPEKLIAVIHGLHNTIELANGLSKSKLQMMQNSLNNILNKKNIKDNQNVWDAINLVLNTVTRKLSAKTPFKEDTLRDTFGNPSRTPFKSL